MLLNDIMLRFECRGDSNRKNKNENDDKNDY